MTDYQEAVNEWGRRKIGHPPHTRAWKCEHRDITVTIEVEGEYIEDSSWAEAPRGCIEIHCRKCYGSCFIDEYTFDMVAIVSEIVQVGREIE